MSLEALLQQCTVKVTIPGRSGWGTGFFVAPGWILTCAHVVKQVGDGPLSIEWQGQAAFATAVVETALSDPFDLALLRFTPPTDPSLPCVYLGQDPKSRDPLYLFGYPDDEPDGAPAAFQCEGLTGATPPRIKFAQGQVRPGMSGAPLLNQRTGEVCGMVKFTRDRSSDLGGGAVTSQTIVEQFPELESLQQQFHQQDRRWSDLMPSVADQKALTTNHCDLPSSSSMSDSSPSQPSNSTKIQQEVTGNDNQIIGQAVNSTIINVSDGGQVHLSLPASAGGGPVPPTIPDLNPPKDQKRGLSRFQKLELERLKTELDDCVRDYQTVSEQLKLEGDGPRQNQLRAQLKVLGRNMEHLEQQINELEHGDEV